MKLRPAFNSDFTCLVTSGSRAAAAALGLLAMAFSAQPALAAADRPAAPTQLSVAAPRGAHEPSRRRLSKYEARKTRHACAARAGERGLVGAEREAFIAHCYAFRLSHRGERQRCRQEAAAKGLDKVLDKGAMRDFLRDCTRERSRD